MCYRVYSNQQFINKHVKNKAIFLTKGLSTRHLDTHLAKILTRAVLSVSFEVAGWVKDVGSWVNEHRRCEPLGGSGGMSPQKILKSRCSEMAFPAFSNTYFPLKWQCKKCNTGAKSVTPVQITHRNSGVID